MENGIGIEMKCVSSLFKWLCMFSVTIFDSSNAVLGETFTHTPTPPKKGNQTFVLRRRNLYCIKTKQKKP
jgi:hypothetical protein